MPDQRVAHVLRVQPRRRDPGLADLEQGQRDARPVQRRALHGRLRRRSSPSRRTSRTSNGVPVAFYAVVSIAVIGLYIAYVIPIYLRWRMGDAFQPALDPRAQVQVDEPVRHGLGRRSSRSSSSCRRTPAGVPWNDEFDWKLVNYAPLVTGGVILAVGIWWLVSAQEHVHRPAPHDLRARRGAGRAARAARDARSAGLTGAVTLAGHRAGNRGGPGRGPARDRRRTSTRRSRAPRRPSRPGARSRRATARALLHRLADAVERAPRGARGARGAQRGQADRRRARRDGHGGRHLPLLRRRARAAAGRHDPGRRRAGVHRPRAARRRRADHAVELPAGDRLVEDGARRWRPATRSSSSPPSSRR